MTKGFIIAGGGSGSHGGGVALPAVSDITTLTAHNRVYVKWTDPEDVEVQGAKIAEWAGTLLVKKAGSTPTSRMDGTIVLDSKERNAYKNEYYCDNGLSDGTTYYYKFFPYTKSKVYTEDSQCEFNAKPEAVKVGNCTKISAEAGGDGKIALTWTDPEEKVVSDGITLATWGSTKVVYKKESYPASPEDGETAINSQTRNAYSASPYRITGLENGVTYYISLFPTTTEGAVTIDDVNRTTGVPNKGKIETVPSQDGTLIYNGTDNTNGTSQAPQWKDYDPTKLELVVTGQSSAGQYDAKFTPKEDYCWNEGDSETKTVQWTIEKKKVAKPSASVTTFDYNKSGQIPSWTGYNAGTMSMTGTTAAQTNAGNYSTKFDPLSNFQWNEGNSETVTIDWQINRIALPKPTVTKSSIVLNSDKTSDTFTVSREGDGVVSATVNPGADIVKAQVSAGTTVTVTSIDNKTGTAKVTIKVTQGTNYNAYELTDVVVSVDAQFMPPTGNPLEQYTWDQISQISLAGEGDNYFNVGDVKSIKLSGKIGNFLTLTDKTLWVYILGFNSDKIGDASKKNIIFGTFLDAATSGSDVCLTDSQYNQYKTDGSIMFNMNHWGNYNYGGWKGCDLRYDILGSCETKPSEHGKAHTTACVGYDATEKAKTSPVANTLMAALPSELRNVLRLMTVKTDNYGNSSNVDAHVTESKDYLPLLAEFEIFGSQSYANQFEKNYQAQYGYYTTGNHKVKYQYNGTKGGAATWWERSPYYDNANNFCIVNTNGGANYYYANGSRGLAPAFCV